MPMACPLRRALDPRTGDSGRSSGIYSGSCICSDMRQRGRRCRCTTTTSSSPPPRFPRARLPLLQHLVETYASETNKTAAVWSELADDQLEFRPHARSSSVRQILVHQILSERRFFAEFIGLAEPAVETLLPPGDAPGVAAYVDRLVALARPRLRGAGRRRRGVLARRGAVLRRPAPADLGVLAPGAPHGPSPGPGRRLPPAAGGPRPADLRPHGGRHLDRRRSDHDPGRGAPAGGIIQQQRRVLPSTVRREVRHG